MALNESEKLRAEELSQKIFEKIQAIWWGTDIAKEPLNDSEKNFLSAVVAKVISKDSSIILDYRFQPMYAALAELKVAMPLSQEEIDVAANVELLRESLFKS
jgi:hypothetical protein